MTQQVRLYGYEDVEIRSVNLITIAYIVLKSITPSSRDVKTDSAFTLGRKSQFVGAQCRINHVADVANATGLRPQGGLRKSRKFFSARQYTSNLT